jgi:hypothetical protein
VVYEYTVKGIGPKAGGLSGWCLIWAYMFIGIAGVTGFTHFAAKLLTMTNAAGYLSPPYVTLFALCVLAAWLLAYKDITNDAGLFGAMGFCGAYVLISLATPFYLKKIGELKAHHVLIAMSALVLLIVPIVGTVYPAPPFPENYFPYIFVAYLLAGVALVSIRSLSHAEIDRIRKVLEETAMAPAAAVAAVPHAQAPKGGTVPLATA